MSEIQYTRLDIWGTYSQLTYECSTCFAHTSAREAHTQWHEALDAGARTVGELAVRVTAAPPRSLGEAMGHPGGHYG